MKKIYWLILGYIQEGQGFMGISLETEALVSNIFLAQLLPSWCDTGGTSSDIFHCYTSNLHSTCIPQQTDHHPLHLPWQVFLWSSQKPAIPVGKLGITGTPQEVPTQPHPAGDISWDWWPSKEADPWGEVAALCNSASIATAAETLSQSCEKGG